MFLEELNVHIYAREMKIENKSVTVSQPIVMERVLLQPAN